MDITKWVILVAAVAIIAAFLLGRRLWGGYAGGDDFENGDPDETAEKQAEENEPGEEAENGLADSDFDKDEFEMERPAL